MKRTGDEMDEEAIVKLPVFQFPDFSLENEEIWQIVNNIGPSPEEVNGVLYQHRKTGRPVIILVEPGEYQVCYMQKILSNKGEEIEGYCFQIFDADDNVGNQMNSLFTLLDEYYCIEMSVVESIMASELIDEMFSFLRQDEVEYDDTNVAENKERRVIKAKRTTVGDSPTLVVDTDRM